MVFSNGDPGLETHFDVVDMDSSFWTMPQVGEWAARVCNLSQGGVDGWKHTVVTGLFGSDDSQIGSVDAFKEMQVPDLAAQLMGFEDVEQQTLAERLVRERDLLCW